MVVYENLRDTPDREKKDRGQKAVIDSLSQPRCAVTEDSVSCRTEVCLARRW